MITPLNIAYTYSMDVPVTNVVKVILVQREYRFSPQYSRSRVMRVYIMNDYCLMLSPC